MKDDNKPSIIKEALSDYNEIKIAAEINANKRLASEFPEKFNKLLKEELQTKNKKESYKKVDDDKESDLSDKNESNNEQVMTNQTKETKTVKEGADKNKPFNTATKKVDEDVKITDTVGDSNPFTEKSKKVQKVDENLNGVKPLQTEEFDITELDLQGVGNALENADDDDEIITMDEIEQEIQSIDDLNNMEGEQDSDSDDENESPYDKLNEIKNQIEELLGSISNETPDEEKPVEEMHAAGNERFGNKAQVNQLHQGNPLIDEIDITDADIDAVINGDNAQEDNEQDVDEAHGVTYSNRRNSVGRHIPAADYLSQGESDQSPEYVQESKIKINNLIKENKILTKKLNETKKHEQQATSIVEQYKSALEKYRNQLREMATFNTNLSNVNNLLVNESLALTQEEKVKIINEFRQINTITESQNKYKTILAEMQGSKKTISESIEDKVSTSIQSSSKQCIDEAVEKTAYKDNEHIDKMKKLINYSGKK